MVLYRHKYENGGFCLRYISVSYFFRRCW